MADDDRYLIWSNEHRGWWRHGGGGYARRSGEAGIFSRSEALAISTQAMMGRRGREPLREIPVRQSDLAEMLVAFSRDHPGIDPEPAAFDV